MKILLHCFNFFLALFLLLFFSGKVEAQCSINSSMSTSSLTCGTSPLNSCGGILYIGNGTDSMILTMSANLDLTCLGAIRFIVRNGATVDFSNGNYDLTLKEGSSIEIEPGGQLGAASNCSASDLIKIGTEKIASCNGQGGAQMDFPTLVTNGGYSSISASASPSSFCNSGSSTITALANPSSGATYKWYTVSSGGSAVFTGNPFSTGSITATTTYYVEASYTSPAYTTVRKPVTVTVNPLPTITGSLNVCIGSTTTLTGSATANATTPWISANTSVATISSSGVVTGVTAGTSVITYMNNNGCTKTATITVNALPDNTSSSGFSGGSFCTGSQATLTFDAVDTNGAPPYTLSYTDGTTTFSQNIPTNAATTFNVSATTSTGYTLNSITNANGCVNLSPSNKTASVTFRPTPTATVVGTTAVCVGATSPNITFTNPQTAGISVSYTINGGAIQTVSIAASGSANVSVPTTTSGLFVYALVNVVYSTNPTCTQTLSGSATVTVNPLPTTPAVSITQPTCTLSTGTIIVTIQNAGETYSFDNGSTFQPGNSKSGLAAGSYNVIIKSAGGCDSSTTNVTIKSAINIWDGSVWSNSTPPISTENIVFNGAYTSSSDLVGCSCQVSGLVGVSINSGHTLTLTNGLTVAASGSMTFQNNASLVQINNVSNTGNIKYIRTTNTVVLSTDYTYWSSPVSPQNIGSFSPKTREGMMYSYDSSIDDWKQEYLATSMVTGAGYIVRGPEPSALPPPPSPYTVNFVGVPHNGNYSVSAIADRSYLLGNPYPSALDADTFLNANSNVLDGTLYFWTHNTPIGTSVSNPGTGIYAYSGDDYATYNQTGGTVAASTGGSVPNGKIGAGQGFFASTKTSISGSAIVYDNSMRVGVGGITGSNSQFFKTRNPKEKVASPIEKNRVWLNLTNTQGAFKQTLVGYITDATNDYDGRFDGESFDGNKFLDFYSVNQDKNLTIQGRALPFDENDEVPLGFRSTIDGDFTIKIDQTDGLLANQSVYIEDKLANTVFDLKTGNYTFNTVAGTFNDRFVLRYTDKTINGDKTLGLDEVDPNDGIIVLYSNNYKTLIVRNNLQDMTVNSVSLFNISGQKINNWDVQGGNQTSIQIPIKNLPSEIYIVKVKTTKGETSKKIVIR